ncbi:glucosyltransferase domain-containing protein [Butyrivibrio sp. NC2007]|uniref:glucosyltransferase domain-containing protein n=1 Tax=Butyrivibrio sp. NC2007 TaxID=1280683 RepID=UPI0003B40D1C|nr:glucosyltransferase domain-containing protein [Butyrivibrio sp. NC2007]
MNSLGIKYNEKGYYFIKYTMIIMLISVVCFLPIIANSLTNSYDGLWYSTYYQAGNLELASGRWAWLFLDKIREGYSAEPFNSLLALLFMTAGTYFLFLPFMHKKHILLYALLIIVSTTTCCYLSYRFQSPTFGASFFTATLSAWFVINSDTSGNIKKVLLSCALGTLLLSVSLGLYQSNIGCFCLALLAYSMYMLLSDNRANTPIILIRGIGVLLAGCIVYKILWDVALILRHTAAASYRGADSVSILTIIKMLPQSILGTYASFVDFFSFNEGYYVFKIIRCFLVIVLFAFLLFQGIRKLRNNLRDCILFIALWLLIPVAANLFLLLAPFAGWLSMQMTGPLSIVVPLLLCVLEQGIKRAKICLILGCVFLYGNIYAVGTDIDALSQGMTSSQAIVQNVIASITEEEIYSDDNEYLFVGNISDSPLFRKNILWSRASSYAKAGDSGIYSSSYYDSYKGVLDDIGIQLKIGSLDDYFSVLEDDSVLSAPNYPNPKSIIKKGNLVIIKISDNIGIEYPQ